MAAPKLIGNVQRKEKTTPDAKPLQQVTRFMESSEQFSKESIAILPNINWTSCSDAVVERFPYSLLVNAWMWRKIDIKSKSNF